MSAAAIFDTTMALARRIRDAAGLEVHIGSPLRREMGTARVALTLVHIQPNAALRNTPVFRAPPPSAPVTAAASPVAAIPFDLHFLITCYRVPAPGGVAPPEPGELASLGQIIRVLYADPILTGSALPGQDVRLSSESHSLEDMNRIWGLFPEEPFRTSIVYLASPIFIEVGDAALYPPLQSREIDGGLARSDAA
ncbi:MAG TPA: Pvc16 family protein [Allosphingosinicella sp.]|nr:Pvc16 family protein [Allosphingosinicella sp.]